MAEIFSAIDLEAIDHGGLVDVGAGHDHPIEAEFAGLDCHGERAFDGEECAVEAQLAHNQVAVKVRAIYLAVGSEDSDGNGEIIGGAFLADVGGRHIDQDSAMGRLEVALGHGTHDALEALLDGSVREAHDGEVKAGTDGDFNRDNQGLNALNSSAISFD